jgi:hypothetical protein
MEQEGGCACGTTRYKLTAAPLIVHACHCRDCQRLSGGAFALNVWIEKRFVEADQPPGGDQARRPYLHAQQTAVARAAGRVTQL